MGNKILCIEDMSLTYYPHFLSHADSTQLFTKLRQSISWQQEQYQMFGKQIPSPRLVAWYGDKEAAYRYSGILHQPNHWLPELLSIKEIIEQKFNLQFNSVLVNLYRNESDSMGYHSDNEIELGKNPTIASLSLGVTRKFNLKHKKNKSLHKMTLTEGSLLIMSGDTQNHWHHTYQSKRRRQMKGST
jgi:alkylated DNA repair dioxygenase AlkB